jgi:hypothetical protein
MSLLWLHLSLLTLWPYCPRFVPFRATLLSVKKEFDIFPLFADVRSNFHAEAGARGRDSRVVLVLPRSSLVRSELSTRGQLCYTGADRCRPVQLDI